MSCMLVSRYYLAPVQINSIDLTRIFCHGNVQYYKFEFVVMCTGKYGDVPRMPVFPPGKGPEVFKGTVMHSLDYCKLSEEETVELMRGRKVVVVGYKKSAIDLANECVQANQGA